jgi:hypothetical protein
MQIRRPLAGLFVALALIGGGATLTGCKSPSNSDTGTPMDTVPTTASSGADNSLPDNGSRETSSSRTGPDVGNG